MTECLQDWKKDVKLELYERHTKLLGAVEEKLCVDTVSCEHLTELLSMLAAKEENLQKLMLLKETEEESMMDKLEADIVKTMNLSFCYFISGKPVQRGWLTESKQQRVSGARIGLMMWVHIQAD